METKQRESAPFAEYYQVRSAKAAIARELARMIDVSATVMDKKVAADNALSEYRDALRQAAREAVKNLR